MSGSFDRVEVTAKNYRVESGEFIGVKAQGQGKFNMTLRKTKYCTAIVVLPITFFLMILVKATIDFKADLRIYEKEGENYIDMVNRVVTTDLEHAYYDFENLKSADNGKFCQHHLI